MESTNVAVLQGGMDKNSLFLRYKKLKFYHTDAALAAPPYSYSPWKTTQICAKKLRLKRNSCGATGSQSCGGSHGQTSFITSYIVVGIVVKRVVDHRFSILTRSSKSGGQGHFWWFRKRTIWFQNIWKHTNHVPNHIDCTGIKSSDSNKNEHILRIGEITYPQ